jgi:hypothetical protein
MEYVSKVQLHLSTDISIGSADASDDTVEVIPGPRNEPYMSLPPKEDFI